MSDPEAMAQRPLVQNFEPARRHVGDGPDTDGDGLSDDFEKNVFFSDPDKRDADNDGLNDWAEYWVDTNPHSADTDKDGWMDGEDLAFGDPLRHNAGGAERAKFIADARRQFEAEGSDHDKDLARDHVEKDHGTKGDDPDSDNDGLGDMVELQLKTDGTSADGDTSDLDTARARLGERRWEAENAGQSGSSAVEQSESAEFASFDASQLDIAAVDSFTAIQEPAYEAPAYEAPAYEAPAYDEGVVDVGSDTAVADAADAPADPWA